MMTTMLVMLVLALIWIGLGDPRRPRIASTTLSADRSRRDDGNRSERAERGG